MVQLIRAIIILVITVLSVSGYVEAQDWAVDDFYRDTPPLLINNNRAVNLSFKKESNAIEYKEREKTLGEDLHEFLKENVFTYAILWSARGIYDQENVRTVLTPSSIPNWLHNMSEWQNCNQAKFAHHLCSPASKPFWAFPLWDGDAIHTNLVQHPIFGAGTYLYYRQMGYDRTASGVASAGLSALFE